RPMLNNAQSARGAIVPGRLRRYFNGQGDEAIRLGPPAVLLREAIGRGFNSAQAIVLGNVNNS
ncbi:hypothetical protein, partial [Ralstonia pseudosolanacearum]